MTWPRRLRRLRERIKRDIRMIEELKEIEKLLDENPPKVLNAKYRVRQLIEKAEI